MIDYSINAQTTKSKNPLNAYRSYNYIFTLAALRKEALADPEYYRKNDDYFVIAKSGGKGSAGIQSPAPSATSNTIDSMSSSSDLIAEFNRSSPGRFDFYINNVQISAVVGGNEDTSMSLSNLLDFEILEPYSMSGFIAALQVSAVAAGWDQYRQCSYLLKMEFLGYPDGIDLPETAESVPNSTRYFVFTFRNIEIDVTEGGARYQCHCVAYNETGFGEPASLKSNIQITGSNVGTILKNFADKLNQAMRSDATAIKNEATKCDQYEIVMPKVDNTGIVSDSYDEFWNSCTITDLLKTPAVYAFADPGIVKSKTDTVRYDPDPNAPAIFFAEKANIHECIASIIRDSDYTKNLIKEFPNNVDQYGMIKYFMIHLEVEHLDKMDDKTNKPLFKYRYVVIPYKMHYTRLPLTLHSTVDTSKLITKVNREYDYIYSGANIDVLKFNLKFNSLYFLPIASALGDTKGQPAAVDTVQPDNYINPALISKPTSDSQASSLGVQPIRAYPDFTQVNPKGVANSGQPQGEAIASLAKVIHQAILENVDQSSGEIEIIGDPYYLTMGTIGNYRPTANADGTLGEGEAPASIEDVLIIIAFRKPTDIDPVTGEAMFDEILAPYSGIFRVIRINSTFKDGVFTQRLSIVRMPGQVLDTNIASKPRTPMIETTPDSANLATPKPAESVSTLRADPNSLLSSITSGLPVAGLPNNLSQLIPSAIGGLAGKVTSAAAGMVTWGATAASAGMPNITGAGLASTTLESGLSNVSAIGSSAMAAATNLGSGAANILSGVGSKVAGLTSANASIAGSLGINTSNLSGLSSNLQSKVASQLTDAIKTIPAGVDVNKAVKDGLILNNIPKSGLANIPITQPLAFAPPAVPNLTDIKAIINRGGSLANIPGASSIPGVDKLLASSGIKLPSGLGLDAASVAGKLATAQSGLGSITGQSLSVEASIGSISSVVPSGLPNVSNISSSVVSKFGSVSANAASPLTTIMKSVS